MTLTPLEPWIARKIGCPGPLRRPEIEGYQLCQLNETLALARARSSFYRQHLASAPPALGSLAALRDLSFTTARDLAAAPLRFLCVSQDEIRRVVTLDTSGSTGPAKRLYFSAGDQELTVDFFQAGMSTLVGPGDRVLILLPCERPGSVGDLLAGALLRLGAVPLRHGPVRDAAETLAYARREGPDCLVGVPVQALALARLGPDLVLESALLTMDHVPHAIQAVVESAWGCRV